MKMRICTVMLAVSLVLPVLAWARSGTIKGNYVGCVSESALDEFIDAAIAKDYRQMQVLMRTRGCANLKGHEYSTVKVGLAKSKIRVHADGPLSEFSAFDFQAYVPTEAIRK